MSVSDGRVVILQKTNIIKENMRYRCKVSWGAVAIFASSFFAISILIGKQTLSIMETSDEAKIPRPHVKLRTVEFPKFNLNLKQPTILMWVHPWGVKTEGIREGTIIGGCLFTYNREKLHEAHAVVFHQTAFSDSYVPQPWKHFRHPDQIFVWYSMESPSNIRNFSPNLFDEVPENFINWTMSYRTDADVFYPYVNSKLLLSAIEAGSKHVSTILSKKSRVALWVVSNCNKTKSARDRWNYINELIEAGLPVDRYGKCFNNSEDYKKLLNQPEKIASYKFYLAFENGHNCRDYLTEKFWDNSLLSGRVPVVWGPKKKDVEALAPLGSFIHTDDFQSPQNLAAYLLYLNRSTIAYRRYFAWMEKKVTFNDNFINLYERSKEKQLCYKIRNNKNHTSIQNLRKYLFTNDRKSCFS